MGTSADKSDKLSDVVCRLIESGDLAAAVALCGSTEEDAAPIELVIAGRDLEDAGKFDAARRAFEAAVRREPLLDYAHIALGELRLGDGDPLGAVASFKRALELDPSSVVALTLLGVAHREIGDDDSAISTLRRALVLDPNYEEAHFNLAAALAKLNPAEAERHFERAIEIDPDYALAHSELGAFLLRQMKLPGPAAEHHLRRAIELNPEDIWARLYLGNYLWRHTRSDEALEQFRLAAEVRPSEPAALSAMSGIYADRKEWSQVAELCDRALQLDPDCVPAMLGLARVFMAKGKVGRAESYVQRALDLVPESKPALKLRWQIEEHRADRKNRKRKHDRGWAPKRDRRNYSAREESSE